MGFRVTLRIWEEKGESGIIQLLSIYSRGSRLSPQHLRLWYQSHIHPAGICSHLSENCAPMVNLFTFMEKRAHVLPAEASWRVLLVLLVLLLVQRSRLKSCRWVVALPNLPLEGKSSGKMQILPKNHSEWMTTGQLCVSTEWNVTFLNGCGHVFTSPTSCCVSHW